MKTFEFTVMCAEDGETADDAWEAARESLGRKVAEGTYDTVKGIGPGESESTTVQQLLDEAKNHADGLADESFPVPEDARGKLLRIIALWHHDDVRSPEDALEEYGDNFMQILGEEGLQVVLAEKS